jgi:predicted RNase H-like nuclease (RuvC/YqgF family)
VAAAEGTLADAEAEARPEPPAKAAPRPPRPLQAPAPPAQPTARQQTLEASKDKEMFETLQDEVKILSYQLKQSEREKQQLKEAQKATTRGRQEQKPTKTNARRRQDRVCVETNHKDHNILSFYAVRKPGCIRPAGNPSPPITTQLV